MVSLNVDIDLDDVAHAISHASESDNDEIQDFLVDVALSVGSEVFVRRLIRRLAKWLEPLHGPNTEFLVQGVDLPVEGDVTMADLIKALSTQPSSSIIALMVEALRGRREQVEKVAELREQAEWAKRSCASCEHPTTYHKGLTGPDACLRGCDCEGFELKDEAPCECGHTWSDHKDNPKYTCYHAIYTPDCICMRFHIAGLADRDEEEEV